eukprot:4864300-Prymnesium_polylepis.1
MGWPCAARDDGAWRACASGRWRHRRAQHCVRAARPRRSALCGDAIRDGARPAPRAHSPHAQSQHTPSVTRRGAVACLQEAALKRIDVAVLRRLPERRR